MKKTSALLAICAGNSPVTGEFPTQRPVTRSFDVFFDLRLNKRLSEQSRGWWFVTPSSSLWRHSNGEHRAEKYNGRYVCKMSERKVATGKRESLRNLSELIVARERDIVT